MSTISTRQLPPEAGASNSEATPAANSGARRSLVSGGAFALGNTARRVFTFLLLPVYTAVLSPAEYGRLGLLITIQGGVTIALTAGMETGVFRRYFYLEGDPAAQRRYVASAWAWLSLVAPCLAVLMSVPIALVAPSSSVFHPDEAVVAILGAAVLVAATIVPLTVLRAEQRLKDYLVLTLVTGLSTGVFTVLFVVVLRGGVLGYFVGMLIANVLTFLTALYVVPWRRTEGFDWPGMRTTLKIAVPLIPHTLAHWSLILMDRMVLALLVSASALGIYTLASNLALPALILVLSLNQGFMPSYAKAQSGNHAVKELRDSITAQVILVLFIGCAIALLAPIVVDLMDPSYAQAASLIPWLVLGYVFLGFYYVPMNAISLIVGRTTFVWIFTMIAAAANLGLIYVFAPIYGLIAAAEASAAGYLLLLAMIAVYAMKLSVRLSIDWRRIGGGTALFAATYAIGALLTPANDVVTGTVSRSVLLLLAILVVGRMSGVRASAVIGRARAVLGTRRLASNRT